MHQNKNKHICNNCGGRGHFFKHCRLPISSFGVILVRKHNTIFEYLMICRKKTFGYIDFISGNYNIYDGEHIINMIKQMTIHEKKMIQDNNFETLWKELWKPLSEKKNYSILPIINKNENKHEYENENEHENENENQLDNVPKTKFNYIKQHYLEKVILQTKSFGPWKDPEWEFPKGRKNYKESDYDCALRETTEETGYSIPSFHPLTNRTFDEIFIGSNRKKYRHKYYVMSIDYEKSLIQGEFDLSEVSSIAWKTLDDCINTIRPYNIEKKKVLVKIHDCIKDIM